MALHERSHQARVAVAIGAQCGGRSLERVLQHDRVTIVERVRERGGGQSPGESELLERKRTEKRRRCGHGMNGRADVVTKPWERELLGARPSADPLVGLEHEDRMALLGERDRGSEPIRSRPYDDCVIALELRHGWFFWRVVGERGGSGASESAHRVALRPPFERAPAHLHECSALFADLDARGFGDRPGGEHAALGDQMRLGRGNHDPFLGREPEMARARGERREGQERHGANGNRDRAREVQCTVVRGMPAVGAGGGASLGVVLRDVATKRSTRPKVKSADDSAARIDHVPSEASPTTARSSVGRDSTSADAPLRARRRATSARTSSRADSASRLSGRPSNVSSSAAAARPKSPGFSTPARTRPK